MIVRTGSECRGSGDVTPRPAQEYAPQPLVNPPARSVVNRPTRLADHDRIAQHDRRRRNEGIPRPPRVDRQSMTSPRRVQRSDPLKGLGPCSGKVAIDWMPLTRRPSSPPTGRDAVPICEKRRNNKNSIEYKSGDRDRGIAHDQIGRPGPGDRLSLEQHVAGGGNSHDRGRAAQNAQHEEDDHQRFGRLQPFLPDDLLAKVLECERINRVEVGAAVTAAKRDRFDFLAASRALLGVAPGRPRAPRPRPSFPVAGAFSQP